VEVNQFTDAHAHRHLSLSNLTGSRK